MNELASVELTVTTAALLKAIGLLAIHFPEKFHLEAWRALTSAPSGRPGCPPSPSCSRSSATMISRPTWRLRCVNRAWRHLHQPHGLAPVAGL